LLHRKPDLTRRRFLDLIRLTFGMLACACVALGLSTSYGQTQMTAAAAFATKYFLDAPPTKDDLVNLPAQARDLIVAKVRLSKAVWLGRRDQSGMPAPPTKNIFFAQIELLDVLSGAAKSGDQLEVFIATAPDVQRYITPATPAMKAREYFIATFLDRDKRSPDEAKCNSGFGDPTSQAAPGFRCAPSGLRYLKTKWPGKTPAMTP
jgi:hypothetical protein